MSDRSAKRNGADADAEPHRITVKDNRRINPRTGEVRVPAEGETASETATAATPGDVGPVADAAIQSLLNERTADLQRLAAEYKNYRDRTDRDKQAAALAGRAAVMADLLTVLDDLDRADEHGDLTGAFKTVADKLVDALRKAGLERYGVEGDEFDPNFHEAVQFTTSSDVAAPTVAAVLRAGYLFSERVLRAAVVVVTGPEHDDAVADDGAPQAESTAGSQDDPDAPAPETAS